VVVRSGANVLVAGSAIFGDREGVAAAMLRLQTAIVDPEDGREPAGATAL
jgi:pentose-5-phosphate-3-epimerase